MLRPYSPYGYGYLFNRPIRCPPGGDFRPDDSTSRI